MSHKFSRALNKRSKFLRRFSWEIVQPFRWLSRYGCGYACVTTAMIIWLTRAFSSRLEPPSSFPTLSSQRLMIFATAVAISKKQLFSRQARRYTAPSFPRRHVPRVSRKLYIRRGSHNVQRNKSITTLKRM